MMDLLKVTSKSNRCCTYGVTPKRVTTSGVHLRGLVPGQHNFEEMMQRWQPLVTLCLIVFCVDSHVFLPITKKRSKRYNKLAYEMPATCLPDHDGEIPLSAFANGTTSKPACLFSV